MNMCPKSPILRPGCSLSFSVHLIMLSDCSMVCDLQIHSFWPSVFTTSGPREACLDFVFAVDSWPSDQSSFQIHRHLCNGESRSPGSIQLAARTPELPGFTAQGDDSEVSVVHEVILVLQGNVNAEAAEDSMVVNMMGESVVFHE